MILVYILRDSRNDPSIYIYCAVLGRILVCIYCAILGMILGINPNEILRSPNEIHMKSY